MKLEIPELAMVRIVHVNPRTQEHGDETLPALDVRVEWDTTAAVLAEFHPELRDALYYELGRDQSGIEGAGAQPRSLIFPDLGPLKWRGELQGMTFSVELGSLAPVVLPACKVGAVTLEPKEGEAVLVSFRLQACPVGEREVGKLATMIGARVLATLKPAPEPEDAAPAGNGEDHEPNLSAWPFGVTGDAIPPGARPLKAKPVRRKRDATEEFVEMVEAEAGENSPEHPGDGLLSNLPAGDGGGDAAGEEATP